MITLQNIVLQRGAHRLLDHTSATLHPGRCIGIIGANGCGKSSLFQLLLGELSLDEGELNFPKQWRVAHMAQELHNTESAAVSFVLDGDTHLRGIEAAIAHAEKNDDHNALAKLYAEFETINGYNAQNRAEQLLHGLGFSQAQITKPVSQFSGGWRIRLNLAQALMCPSELLLLDEPTNHLDLDATLWLEQWLKAYTGTLLLISHDRDFLDNIVDEILHIEQKQLITYRGNYTAFERQRAERLAHQQAHYIKQQQRVAEIHKFVTRFKAKASKARQAQSRLKELSRMETIAPAHIDSPFHFIFSDADKISDPLINLRSAQLGYDDTPILQNVNLNLHPGSRIGLLGLNGTGKSTLVKSLVGDLTLQTGERICGEHLAIGYFAQHQLEALDLDASPIQHLQRLTPTATEQNFRNFLGGFNFHGDKALAAIRPFSGGEKARLALAIIVWQRPNLLLLDEPTNHLDLEMRYALTVALQAYTGALVVISHDRHLLRNCVDEFYLLSENKLTAFDGTLDNYYLLSRKTLQNKPNNLITNNDTDDKIDKKAQRQQAAAQRQKLKPLTDKIRKLEKELHKAQDRLVEIQNDLALPDLYDAENKTNLKILLDEQRSLKKDVENKETIWLALHEELEAIQKNC